MNPSSTSSFIFLPLATALLYQAPAIRSGLLGAGTSPELITPDQPIHQLPEEEYGMIPFPTTESSKGKPSCRLQAWLSIRHSCWNRAGKDHVK